MSCLERILHRVVNSIHLAKILWSPESASHSRILYSSKRIILQSVGSHWEQRWRPSSFCLLPVYIVMQRSLSMCLNCLSRFCTNLLALANFVICSQHVLRVIHPSYIHIENCSPTPFEIRCLQSEVDTLGHVSRRWVLLSIYNSQALSKQLLLITHELITHEVPHFWKTSCWFSMSYTKPALFLNLAKLPAI